MRHGAQSRSGRPEGVRHATACATAGALLLALGTLPYVLCRSLPPVALAVLGYGPALQPDLCHDMSIHWWLPSFAHAGGFGLVTCATLPARRRWILMAGGFWLSANIIWEIAWRRAGALDWADLTAAAIGAGAAIAFGMLSQRVQPSCPEAS